ncbi:MAG: hypothetical protein JKX72_03700 [Robiginitomaculum sp.]|nr:hypothetical protein [Robiginitomaculum sp.]
MNTSTNKDDDIENINGALADGLTLVRVLLTPLIMFIIIRAWSGQEDDPMGFVSLDLALVLLASFLFAIAALTDLLDDKIGGSLKKNGRLLGWFDDMADSVLVGGTLLALLWVTYKAGLLHWSFAVPAFTIIGRDIFLALVKGSEFSKYGFLETRLGDIKSALAMLATCILVASPWLSNFIDGLRAGDTAESALKVYDNASPIVWNIGLVILWIAAILAVITAFKFMTAKMQTPDETKA